MTNKPEYRWARDLPKPSQVYLKGRGIRKCYSGFRITACDIKPGDYVLLKLKDWQRPFETITFVSDDMVNYITIETDWGNSYTISRYEDVAIQATRYGELLN